MKVKYLSVLVSTLIITTISISNAQLPPTPPAATIQPDILKIADINLSNEQIEELMELQEEAISSMMGILTSRQKGYLERSVRLGRKPQDVIKSISLSRQQKNQLEDIEYWQRTQLLSILNNQQKRQLMKAMRQRQRR